MNQKTCSVKSPHIQLLGGTLSVDDTVIDKPYSNPNLTELIGYFWSGKHHRIVKGLNLLTLYYTDGKSFPVNYRLYDKRKGLKKYFRNVCWGFGLGLYPKWWLEMLGILALKTWNSENQELGFHMGITKNRKVSLDGISIPR